MKNMDIDNIFKDKLYGHSEEPPAHIWAGIQQTRTPLHIWLNKVKLNAWKYAAVLAVVLFISGVTYFQMQNEEPKLTKNTGSAIEKSNETSNVSGENNLNQGRAIESISPVKIPENNSGSSDMSGNRNIVSTSKPGEAKEIHKGNDPILEKKSPEKRNDFVEPAEHKGVGQDIVAQETPKPIDKVEEMPKEKPEIVEVIKKEGVEFPIESNTIDPSVIPTPPSPNPTIKPKKGYSVELAYGALYAFRTLNGNESTTKNLRNKSEEQKYSYQLGLRLNKELNMHWELQTGLNYLVRNEQIDHTLLYSKNEMEVKETTVWVQRPNGLPIQKVISDTTYVNRKYSDVTNRTNTYKYLSIPVTMRYNYYLKQVGFFASAGVMFDVYKNNNALILNQTEKLEAASDNAMVASLHSRGLLSIGVSVRLNNSLSWLLEPVTTYSLHNLSSKSYGLKQREYTYGLQTSFRYNF